MESDGIDLVYAPDHKDRPAYGILWIRTVLIGSLHYQQIFAFKL